MSRIPHPLPDLYKAFEYNAPERLRRAEERIEELKNAVAELHDQNQLLMEGFTTVLRLLNKKE